MEEREERHLRRLIRRDAGARRRVPRVDPVTNADARIDVGRRGAVDDELRAAVIDVVKGRAHLDARRFEPDVDVVRELGFGFT